MSDTDPATPGDAIRSLVAATRATTKAQRERDMAQAALTGVRALTDKWAADEAEFTGPTLEEFWASIRILTRPKP